MPGINPSIIWNKLFFRMDAKLVKQKLIRMNEEWSLSISDEVDHLLQASFIRETFYPN